jgi:hypothetical protein
MRHIRRTSIAPSGASSNGVDRTQKAGFEPAHIRAPRHVANNVQQPRQIALPRNPVPRHGFAVSEICSKLIGFGL